MVKKYLFLSFALSGMFAGAGAQDVCFSLAKIESGSSNDVTEYYYNDDMLVDSIFEIAENGVYVYASLYEYDDNNNCIKFEDFNMTPSGDSYDMFGTSYVAYTYDENNRKIHRENFSNWGDGYTPQARYDIRYNDDGTIAGADVYAMRFSDDYELYSGCDFTYNDDTGLLESELYYNYSDGQKYNNLVKEYEYDAKGQRVLEVIYTIDGGMRMPSTRTTYKYDDMGNIVEWVYSIPGGASPWTDTEKNEFVYDSSKAIGENTFVFVDPELDFFAGPLEYILSVSKNAIVTQRRYIMDEANMQWVLVDNLSYSYNMHQKEGIGQLSADREISRAEYYTVSGLKVQSPEKGLYIRRTVYSDGTVDVEKVLK